MAAIAKNVANTLVSNGAGRGAGSTVTTNGELGTCGCPLCLEVGVCKIYT